MANGLLSDILGFNPAEYQQQQLALLTSPIRQAQNPYERIGASLGSLLGGAFLSPDPQLQRVAKIKQIQTGLAQSGETDPVKLATMFADELSKDEDLASLALQVRASIKPSTSSETKVVPPGAAVLDSQGNEIYRNPREVADNIKTVDLGDRIEYYQGSNTTPFKTERKGEPPTTQFRRELQQVKEEEKAGKQQVAAEQSIGHATKVLKDVEETKNLVGPFTTGGIGGVARFLPQTDARKLSNKIQTIKANLGFDRLQQMRDASPTGGALGQVAVQEINFLQSVVATLDQLESQDDILNALGKIEQHYTNWLSAVRGRNPAAAQSMEQQGTASQPTAKTVVVPKGVTVRKVQ
jgi:hypothetical protein